MKNSDLSPNVFKKRTYKQATGITKSTTFDEVSNADAPIMPGVRVDVATNQPTYTNVTPISTGPSIEVTTTNPIKSQTLQPFYSNQLTLGGIKGIKEVVAQDQGISGNEIVNTSDSFDVVGDIVNGEIFGGGGASQSANNELNSAKEYLLSKAKKYWWIIPIVAGTFYVISKK